MIKPKYFIGNIVQMKDEYSFNSSSKTTSIGKIEAIHIHSGNDTISRIVKDSITYSISGFSLQPREENIKLYLERS